MVLELSQLELVVKEQNVTRILKPLSRQRSLEALSRLGYTYKDSISKLLG